jgi:hypothetical protein
MLKACGGQTCAKPGVSTRVLATCLGCRAVQRSSAWLCKSHLCQNALKSMVRAWVTTPYGRCAEFYHVRFARSNQCLRSCHVTNVMLAIVCEL